MLCLVPRASPARVRLYSSSGDAQAPSRRRLLDVFDPNDAIRPPLRTKRVVLGGVLHSRAGILREGVAVAKWDDTDSGSVSRRPRRNLAPRFQSSERQIEDVYRPTVGAQDGKEWKREIRDANGECMATRCFVKGRHNEARVLCGCQ